MKRVALQELGKIVTGNTPSKSELRNYCSKDIPFIKPDDFSNYSEINRSSSNNHFISEFARPKARIVPEGTVLVTCIGNIGKVMISNSEVSFNQQINGIVTNERVIPEYLAYQLIHNRTRLEFIANAPVVPIVNKTQLSEFMISMHSSVDIQKGIVLRLDFVSSLIQQRLEQLTLLNNLIKSRFNEMFGDGSANINNFPIVSLSELSDEKLSYGSGASAVEFDGEVRYIRITDISDDGTLNIDKKSANVIEKKYLLKDGDILFARSGATVGKTYRYRNSDGIAMFAGYLIKFSPNTSLVNPDYIFHYTRTNFYRRFIEKSQTVVAQPNINAKQYGGLSIPLPPLPLQEEFARFVEAVDKSKFVCQKWQELVEKLLKIQYNKVN